MRPRGDAARATMRSRGDAARASRQGRLACASPLPKRRGGAKERRGRSRARTDPQAFRCFTPPPSLAADRACRPALHGTVRPHGVHGAHGAHGGAGRHPRSEGANGLESVQALHSTVLPRSRPIRQGGRGEAGRAEPTRRSGHACPDLLVGTSQWALYDRQALGAQSHGPSQRPMAMSRPAKTGCARRPGRAGSRPIMVERLRRASPIAPHPPVRCQYPGLGPRPARGAARVLRVAPRPPQRAAEMSDSVRAAGGAARRERRGPSRRSWPERRRARVLGLVMIGCGARAQRRAAR